MIFKKKTFAKIKKCFHKSIETYYIYSTRFNFLYSDNFQFCFSNFCYQKNVNQSHLLGKLPPTCEIKKKFVDKNSNGVYDCKNLSQVVTFIPPMQGYEQDLTIEILDRKLSGMMTMGREARAHVRIPVSNVTYTSKFENKIFFDLNNIFERKLKFEFEEIK